MATVHVKGRLLQILDEEGPHFDHQLADRLATEYGERNEAYWHNSIRLTLADLHSGGLILPEEEDDVVDPGRTFGVEKLVRRYALTDFGRQRMRETGLLRPTAARSGGTP
jgi:hypothetical protein